MGQVVGEDRHVYVPVNNNHLEENVPLPVPAFSEMCVASVRLLSLDFRS